MTQFENWTEETRLDPKAFRENYRRIEQTVKNSKRKLEETRQTLLSGVYSKKEELRSFRGELLPGWEKSFLTASVLQSDPRQVFVDGVPWDFLPKTVRGGARLEVDLFPGEKLLASVDGNYILFEESPAVLSAGGILLDLCVIKGEVGGEKTFLLRAPTGKPIQLVEFPSGWRGRAESRSGEQWEFETRLDLRNRIRTQLRGAVTSTASVTGPTITAFDPPHRVRRGAKAFLRSGEGVSQTEQRVLEVPADRERSVDVLKPREKRNWTLAETISLGGLWLTLSQPGPRGYTVRLVSESSASKGAVLWKTETIAETVTRYRAPEQAVIEVALEVETSWSGEQAAEYLSLFLPRLFTVTCVASGRDLSLETSGSEVISWAGSGISTDFSLLPFSRESIVPGSLRVTETVGGRESNYDLNGTRVDIFSSAEGAMPGELMTLRLDVETSTYGDADPSLLGTDYEVKEITVRGASGNVLLRKEDLILVFGPASLYLYGILPESARRGTGIVELETELQRSEQEESIRDRQQRSYPFSIVRRAFHRVEWSVTDVIQNETLSCDIFSREFSYLPLTKELVAGLAQLDSSLRLFAEHVTPDGRRIDLLERDRVGLEPGWNTLRVSSNLFQVPVIDRGPFDPESGYAVDRFSLGVLRMDTKGSSTIQTADTGLSFVERGSQLQTGEAEAILRGYGTYHAAYVRFGLEYFLVGEVNHYGITVPDYAGESVEREAELLVLRHPYRRFANPFFQNNLYGQRLSRFSGPIFYVQAAEPVPSEEGISVVLSGDPMWGWRSGHPGEENGFRGGARCITGFNESALPDSRETLFLPIDYPPWGWWLAEAEPMVEVSPSDISWSVPEGFERAYANDRGVLSFSSNHLGLRTVLNVVDVVSSGTWPVIVVPQNGVGSPEQEPLPGDWIWFDPQPQEGLVTTPIMGVVLSVESRESAEGIPRYRIQVATRRVPQESTSAIYVRSDTNPPQIVSRFLSGGPSRVVSSPYETDDSPGGPLEVAITAQVPYSQELSVSPTISVS